MTQSLKSRPATTKVKKSTGVANMAFTELWERFSFYGLQAILPFYLLYSIKDGGLELNAAAASGIVGAYGGSVYLAQLAGAWLGDRLISPARLVLYGGVIITAGHIALAIFPGITGVVIGLILIIVGTGALKTNITTIVGYILDEASGSNRDVGFTWFYMAINVGAVLGPMCTGFAQNQVSFHWGFGLAAVGMMAALVQYVFSMRKLPARAHRVPNAISADSLRRALSISGVVAVVVLLVLVLGPFGAAELAPITTATAVGAAAVYFIYMLRSPQITSAEATRVKGYIPFFIGGGIFYGLLFQQFTSIAILVSERVDHSIGDWTFPVAWVITTSQVAAVAVTPLVTVLFNRLGRKFGPAFKFGVGLTEIGVAYFILLPVILHSETASIPLSIMLVTMLAAGISEVFVGPIGLSLATRIGPEKFKSQFVALNFLTLGLGSSLSGLFGQYYDVVSDSTYFLTLIAIGVGLGSLFFIFRHPLQQALFKGLD